MLGIWDLLLMQRTNKGSLEVFDASSYRVGVVVSEFNADITKRLLQNCLAGLKKYGVEDKNIKIVRVAGAVEIPLILQALAQRKKYDCLVALGAVIRGDTPHFEYVCKIVAEGVLRVSLDHSVPVGFGVLTCNTKKQALARLKSAYGWAQAALHSAHIIKSL